jgi:hypothetical protein
MQDATRFLLLVATTAAYSGPRPTPFPQRVMAWALHALIVHEAW